MIGIWYITLTMSLHNIEYVNDLKNISVSFDRRKKKLTSD